MNKEWAKRMQSLKYVYVLCVAYLCLIPGTVWPPVEPNAVVEILKDYWGILNNP